MKLPILISYVSLLAFGAYACSDDDKTATPVVADAGGDASTGSDSSTGEGGPTDSSTATDAADASASPGCTDAELEAPLADNTDGGAVTIVFPPNSMAAAPFNPRCVKIKVGQQVTFVGGFETHPLEPWGGTTPSPIPAQNKTPDAGALVITFTSAGTFGFRCDYHPLVMSGAVKVVP
jgi:plastocyanin